MFIQEALILKDPNLRGFHASDILDVAIVDPDAVLDYPQAHRTLVMEVMTMSVAFFCRSSQIEYAGLGRCLKPIQQYNKSLMYLKRYFQKKNRAQINTLQSLQDITFTDFKTSAEFYPVDKKNVSLPQLGEAIVESLSKAWKRTLSPTRAARRKAMRIEGAMSFKVAHDRAIQAAQADLIDNQIKHQIHWNDVVHDPESSTDPENQFKIIEGLKPLNILIFKF